MVYIERKTIDVFSSHIFRLLNFGIYYLETDIFLNFMKETAFSHIRFFVTINLAMYRECGNQCETTVIKNLEGYNKDS